MFRLFISFILSIPVLLSAQDNLDWFKIKIYKITTLSDEIKETSGLTFLNGDLYTINDGGNSATVYKISPENGSIIQQYTLPIPNRDWEAITADSTNFYVADVGNNAGNRNDLKVHQLKSFPQNLPESTIETLEFNYPEQTEFTAKPHRHNFDAESIIYKDQLLHLFTKEWESYYTTHYQLTNSFGNTQSAKKLENYHLGYLATDAAYYDKKLFMVGYTKKMEVFMTIFFEDENGLFFNIKSQKLYLGQSSSIGQIEGIAVNKDGIYISGEEFNYKIFHVKPSLYFIPMGKFEKYLLRK